MSSIKWLTEINAKNDNSESIYIGATQLNNKNRMYNDNVSLATKHKQTAIYIQKNLSKFLCILDRSWK